MPDVLVSDLSTATPTSSSTVLGETAGVVRRFAKDSLGPFVNVKDPTYGATGDGTTDDLTAFSSARTAAGSTGVVRLPGPATYYFAGSRPDLSGVNIWADPDVTIKVDENPNTKDLKLLTPVTIQNTVHGTTLVKPANTKIQLPELFNVAPGLYDLALDEVCTQEDFTTWTHKVYQTASGDIASVGGTGTVIAAQVTWASDFVANPQVIYPATITDGALYEVSAANVAGSSEKVGIFAKNASHIWRAEVQGGVSTIAITQVDFTGTTVSSATLTPPNGGAYGWVLSQEVNLGFVVNSGVTTVVINGLPIYRFPATVSEAGIYISNAGDSRIITLKDPLKTTNYRARVKKPLSIGVIGDSISYGAWCSNDIVDLLPSFIQNMPWVGEVTITNLAVSGVGSGYWASGVGAATDYSSYDLVLCMIGTNDIQSGNLVSGYTNNLGTIATNITGDGAVPIFGIFPIFTQASVSGVTGVTTTNYANHAAYTHALKKFCVANSYTFADVRRAFGANLDWYGDNVHPTVEGQIAIMAAWVEGIGKYLNGRAWFN